MTAHRFGRYIGVLALGLALVTGVPLQAQEPARSGAQEPVRAEGEEAREAPFEGEFVASTIFQSGTAALRLRSPLVLEGHYFGTEEDHVGIVGFGWTLTFGALRLIPGFAWAFGEQAHTAPVLTARWSYETGPWLTQGLWVQSLRVHVPEPGSEEPGEEEVRHASILDGVHVSYVLGRAEIGGLVENVRYREEHEWKGGVRGAWRLGRGVKLVGQVLAPNPEVRGGLAWEP